MEESSTKISIDAEVKDNLKRIPLLTVRASPRDGDAWVKRLKEEYTALIKVLYHFYGHLCVVFSMCEIK